MKFEFLGPYRIEQILGQGGMGTVYRGIHAKSNEAVALKVIASSLADQERFRRRFAAEVETLKRLKHPHIVQLIGYGEEQGHLFYSMEYVPGKSLAETLRAVGKLPWSRVLEVAIEVASALKHAHDLGIIHRDLKPANVMINEAGRVKLTDFGIAKLFGSTDVTAAGSVLGTADYMPPEQAEGKPVSARSDLYALGALMFAMTTGRSPHFAKSVPEVLYNVRYSIPLRLDLAEPGTPIEIAELVEHLLKKETADRPPTALVVGNRLQSLRLGLEKRNFDSSKTKGDAVEQANEFTSIDLDLDIDKSTPTKNIIQRAEEQTQIVPPDWAKLRSDPTKESLSPSGIGKSETPTHNDSTDMSFIEEPVPAGKTRFTIVEEEKRASTGRFGLHEIDDAVQHHPWLSVAGLVLLIATCVGTIIYFLRPASAENLHARITTAAESGSDEMLLDIEPLIDEFQSRFPNDPRGKELELLKSEIEQQRTVRRLMRRNRMTGDGSELDPVEQAFLDCQKTEREQPQAALTKWKAFIIVFGASDRLSEKQRTLTEIAKESLAKLEAHGELHEFGIKAALQAEIDSADAKLKGTAREAYFRAVIELYQDKAWAKDIVERARKEVDRK